MLPKRPMKASDFDQEKLRFPLIVEPKLDGIRVVFDNGVCYSYRLKPLPNQFLQDYCKRNAKYLQGLDGEVIVGEPTAPDVYRKTESGVMSRGGRPAFRFVIFDRFDQPTNPYRRRLRQLQDNPLSRVFSIDWEMVTDLDDLKRAYAQLLKDGYEGACLRDPNGPYKYGRSTPREGWLIKMKEIVDEEAKIIGFVEQTKNNNPQKLNALGLRKRSSHKANKSGKDTLGAIEVRSKKYDRSFFIGTGFDDALRKKIWSNQKSYMGKWVKFAHQPYGMKDVPRVPRFLGFRNEIDL